MNKAELVNSSPGMSKYVVACVHFHKELETENFVEQHYLIGWGLGYALETHVKELYRVRKMSLEHEADRVVIDLWMDLSLHIPPAHYEDYKEYFAGWINLRVGQDSRSRAYSYYPVFFRWDSAEYEDITLHTSKSEPK